MKKLLALSVGVLLFSCNGDDDPLPSQTEITLTSTINKHPNGGFEYEVFCIEDGHLQRVNTKTNKLKPYSIGVMTYSNSEGKTTGVAITSLTSDLKFVSLNDFVFDEVEELSDSLSHFTLSIEATENDQIGIISKNSQYKIKVQSATYELMDKMPVAQLIFQGKYLE